MHDQNLARLAVVADAIRSLTYAETMQIGSALASIYHDSDSFDETSIGDWAAMLHAWAENYDEDSAS